jgi:hypothetical protein
MQTSNDARTKRGDALTARVVGALLLAAFALAAAQTPASARACKRICMDGQCWYDCSKLPGQP